MKKKKQYKIETTLTFYGTSTVWAENEYEAHELIKDSVGLTLLSSQISGLDNHLRQYDEGYTEFKDTAAVVDTQEVIEIKEEKE